MEEIGAIRIARDALEYLGDALEPRAGVDVPLRERHEGAIGFAVVLLGLAAIRVASRYRVRTPAAERQLGVGAVLRGILREARRVKADAEGGWTPELASRALTLSRSMVSIMRV